MPNWEYVQSVIRAIEIIEVVSDAHNGMRLSEISAAVKLKNTTVNNLARSLTAKGFLDKDENNFYRLGTAFINLASNVKNRDIVNRLSDIVTRVFNRFPDAVALISEYKDSDIFIKLRISPDKPLVQKIYDSTISPFGSMNGLLFLAYSEERQRLFEKFSFKEFGAHIWKTEENLLKHLELICKKGYSFESEELKRNGFRIAVPIFGSDSKIAFGMGVDFKKKIPSDKEINEIINFMKQEAKIKL